MRERTIHKTTSLYETGDATVTITEKTVHEVRGADPMMGPQLVLNQDTTEFNAEFDEERAPEVGDRVLYKLTEHDVRTIFDRRTKHGFNANRSEVGQVFPGVIVRTWGDAPGSGANLRVFLDGDDTLWVTSVVEGDEPGQFEFD